MMNVIEKKARVHEAAPPSAQQERDGEAYHAAAKRQIGRILLDAGFITPADLERALKEQERTNELLGEVLVRLGVLDSRDLEAALSVQHDLSSPEQAIKAAAGVRRALGEILLRAKRITPEQLEDALQEQRTTGEKLGALLVRKGLLTQGELDRALSFQGQQSIEKPLTNPLRLGELLVSAGYITRQQMEEALERQRLSNKRFGDVLIDEGIAKPHQIAHGLRIQDKLLTAALTAILSIAPLSAAAAQGSGPQSGGAKIMVSATVATRASIRILRQSPSIMVTDADIRRGYVVMRAATKLEIKSNSAAGCLLVFEAHGLPFREVIVDGLGGAIAIGPAGGIISHSRKGSATLELSYRFILPEDIRPGTYNWPLSLSITTL